MTQGTGQCAGCGATIEGSYCSVCGQRRVGRITFRRVFSEAARNLTIGSTFPRTLIGMTTHPGRVAREYVEGRRKAYLNPLKYTFVIATVFALEVNLLEILPLGIDADREAAVSQFRTIIAALAYLAYVHMLPTAERLGAKCGVGTGKPFGGRQDRRRRHRRAEPRKQPGAAMPSTSPVSL